MIGPIEHRVETQHPYITKTKVAPSETNPPAKAPEAGDSVDFVERDWALETGKLLAGLSGQYGSVKFITGNYDRKGLLSLIESTGRGNYVFIDQSFLDAMGSSAEAFYQGKALLEQYANRWNTSPLGKGTFSRGVLLTKDSAAEWSLGEEAKPSEISKEEKQIESLWEMVRRTKEQAEKNKLKTPKKRPLVLSSASKVYAKLARASAQTQVRSVISSAAQSLYRAKMELLNCDKFDRDSYRAVVSQLQTAISRARGKIRQLDQEQSMRRQQQRAERENQIKRARATEQALRKRKSARKAREYSYMSQSALDAYMRGERARQAQVAQYRADRLNERADPVDVTSPTGAAPVAGPSWGTALTPSSGNFTMSTGAVASVTVSPVSFSAPVAV